MKLVTAVVQEPDAPSLVGALIDKGYRATKIGSTGGFLRRGNITLLIGVEPHQVEDVISLIREICHSRTETVPTNPKTQVRVGGAVIFVQDVERFERI